MLSPKPVIGVIGSGREISAELFQVAYDIGALLAQRGAAVACGGLGGVMAAAAKGAAENGGTVIGILPGANKDDANPWVTIAIASGLGSGRNALLARTADVLIALPGAFGTLSEMALALDAGKCVIRLPGAWDVRRAGDLEGARILDAADAKQAVGLALGEIGKNIKGTSKNSV